MSVPKYAVTSNIFSSIPRRVQNQLGLSENRLKNYSVDQLLDILSEIHPDVSFAIWNFIRLGNSGYRISVTKPNGKPYSRGEEQINTFLLNLEQPSITGFSFTKSLNRIINQLLKTGVVRGAASLELVLTDDLLDIAYFAPVDPATIIFKNDNGRIIPWQSTSKQVKLDIPTFFYEGLDSFIDDPTGVSPIVSVIQAVFFQLQVLQDLKAVVHNQGYPKYDIKIIEKVLLERMPISIRNNEQKKQEWLNEKLNEIIQMYNKLEPDDAFVHYDSTEVNLPDAGKAMLDPEKLMNVINEQMNMALKTLSTILGRRANGNTETFAKIEIKLYLKGLEDIQWLIETILSRALTLVLNFKGLQGHVKFKFVPVEIRTALEQEQFRQIAIQNAVTLVDLGWLSDEDACIAVTGNKPNGTPRPEGLRFGGGGGKKAATDERTPTNPQSDDNPKNN